MGIIGMRERVATFGGRFTIESRLGAGTQVELAISLAEPVEAFEERYAEDSRAAG
jgi:glucose-6-phosphate-specific signal transduction histidine kinase